MKMNTALPLVVFVVLVGFGFYWYEWKPNQIRKDCGQEASQNIAVDTIGIGLDTSRIYTLDELGQAIKEKYPEYNDLSNVEVANRTIAKYPEYEAFVSPTLDNSKYEDCLKESGLSP